MQHLLQRQLHLPVLTALVSFGQFCAFKKVLVKMFKTFVQVFSRFFNALTGSDPDLQGKRSCDGGLGRSPNWVHGETSWSEGQRDEVTLNWRHIFFISGTNFFTKLSHKSWICRLHGERGRTSTPAYDGQWVRRTKSP